MYTLRHSLLYLLICFLAPRCTHAPAASPPPTPSVLSVQQQATNALPPALAAFLERYDRYVEQEMSRTQTPGAALVVVKDGAVVFVRGYGVRCWGRSDSIDEHTLFRLGSLSKGFAGVLAGRLVQEGALRWDDPVQHYYPQFTLRDRKQAARIRLWHLLSHTTGLPYHAYTNLIEEQYSIPRIVQEYFPKAPICGREGEFYSYQNAAFCVTEEVMRNATGHSYGDLLREKILLPAGMTTTSCDFASMQRASDHALPHFFTGYGWRADSISPLYYNAAAAGGVNASIADMGEWLRLLLGYQPDVVSDSTLERVFRPVVRTDKERRLFPGWIARDQAYYAMGWRVLVTPEGDTLTYHAGYVNGFKGEIALNRRERLGVCMLFNAHTELSKRCIPEFFGQWRAVSQTSQ